MATFARLEKQTMELKPKGILNENYKDDKLLG